MQEFELVEFKTPYYPTNVIGDWQAGTGLKWLTVIINEDAETDRNAFDRPNN